MRLAPCATLFVFLVASTPAALLAQEIDKHTEANDSSAWVMGRVSLTRSSAHLVNRDSTVVLALLDTALIVQLMDGGAQRMADDARADVAKESMLAQFVVGMVMGGLQPLLDHAIGYRLRDLADARYEGGRLHLVDRNGRELFDHTEVRHRELMEDFDPASARRFAEQVRGARARLH